MSVKDNSSKTKNWQPNPDITTEELEKMRVEVVDRIIIARVGLLLKHPFFGNLASRLRIVAADNWLPTAAVDGKNLYYNTQFFNAMDNKEIEFVIGHEILHLVFDHLGRCEKRNPMLYNIAADYIVNNTLVKNNIGKKPTIVDCFQDFKYNEWTSEEVYDDLFKQLEQHGQQFLDSLGQLLDEHLDLDNSNDSNSTTIQDGNGNNVSNGPEQYSEEDLNGLKDEIKEAIINSAQSVGIGNLPQEIKIIIKDLAEPKINWRELLRQQIQSTIKSDYTFSRPNKKSFHSGAILPGMDFSDSIDICVAIDTSGSISYEQVRDFLSEIKGIMEEHKGYQIKVWSFSTEVYNTEEFDAETQRDILEYNVVGGGGTDFMCNWSYMKDNDINPKKLVVFSDMYSYNFGDPDYCDTLFINHGRPGFEAPFGITVEYNQ